MDLDHVGGAGHAHRHACGHNGQLTVVQVAVLLGQRGGHLDQLIGAVCQRHHQRGDAPAQGQLTLHLLLHHAGDDGLLRAVLAQQTGGVAGLGHGDDGGGVHVLGGQAGSVCSCIAHADLAGVLGEGNKAGVVLLLGALSNGRHGLESIHGVSTGSSLAGKHDGRGAVVDGICHVGDLGTGGAGVHDHAVQHLGSGDDGLAKGEGALDDILLNAGQLGKVNLNAQIAAGHHDSIGCSQNAVDVVHALTVLDLGDDADIGIILVEQVADIVHILRGAHEGSSDEVKALLCAEDDIVAVALAHIRHGQMHAGHIDTLLVLDLAVVQHLAHDVGVVHGDDLQLDQAVVQHDGAAGLHVLRQVLIGDGADLLGAFHLTGGQGEGLAGFQHFSAVLEVLQADLGAFGVQQGGDRLAQLFTNGFQLFKAAQMLLVRAVGKIKTGNIHAVGDQLAQNAFLIGGRAQSADDLCFSHILLLPPTTTSHSLFCGRLSAVIQTAARGQREKSRAVVQKRKNPVVQNFSTYYYIRWDTIGQGKLCAVAEFFRRSRNLCHGMTHLRLKMKKRPVNS